MRSTAGVRRLLPIACLVVALAGCGGSGDGLAPVAEPARSPPLDVAPAGRVLRAGHEPGEARLPGAPRYRRLARLLHTSAQPGRLAVTAMGDRVAVLRPRERALELFAADTLRPLGRIDVGIGPTHVVARGARLFVVDTRGNGLIEVSTDPLRVHRRTHLEGSPYAIAFDPVRKRFWVTLTATNRVAELTDRRVLRSFPTVRQPNSVAVDPVTGRVLVAGRKDGTAAAARSAAVHAAERALRAAYDRRSTPVRAPRLPTSCEAGCPASRDCRRRPVRRPTSGAARCADPGSRRC